MRDVFLTDAMPWLLTVEGRFSLDRNDRGNWTSGKVGEGELRGTKYGISAAAHPGLDIKGLTIEHARDLYRLEYWNAVRGDDLPPVLALAAFDAAVQHGPRPAAIQLQQALHVAGDGVIGRVTLDAARHAAVEAVLPEMFARRAMVYRADPASAHFFHGWMVRLFRLELVCLRLAHSLTQGN